MTRFILRSITLVMALGLAVALPATVGAAAGDKVYTFSKITLSGCDTLEAWYVVDGAIYTEIGDNRGLECSAVQLPRTRVTVTTSETVMIRLVDVSCSAAQYFEDGTGWADHALITTLSSSRSRIDIADGGPGCGIQNSTYTPDPGTGNLTLLRQIRGGI